MSGKKVSTGHVVGAEEQDKSVAEELLEAKGDAVIIGDEEEPEESRDSDGSKTPLKPEADTGHGTGLEEAEKEPKQIEGTKQWKVMLKRAGSYWGRGKKYQREETVLVSQEEYLYLLGTGLFDEVK